MTRSGIEVNLKNSPYGVDINYGSRIIKYMFSGISSMTKFQNKIEENRQFLKESLTNRFKINFYLSDDFCDMILYKSIEKRAFLVYIDGRPIEWQGNLEYSGQRIESKN